MKRISWLGLPLVLALGCHHNLHPQHGGVMYTAGAQVRRFPNTRSQVHFVSPAQMIISWQMGQGGGFAGGQVAVPGRYNFDQGAIYRLRLNNVAGRAAKQYYPSLEIAPSTPRTDAYLTHNAIPIEFTDEDFDQVDAGNFVTKVIYLPDPQHQELAIAGVETLVSTRLDPGVDPIAEADRRGTILAIVRLGGIDLEMPQVMSDGSAYSPHHAIMVGPEQGGAVVQSPQAGSDQPVYIR